MLVSSSRGRLVSRLQQWPNITKMLQDLEALLAAVEERVETTAARVEDRVQQVMEQIEDEAIDAAKMWNATVLVWVDVTERSAADIKTCLDVEEKSMAVVLDGLRADAKACVNDRLVDINNALKAVSDLAPEAVDVLNETEAQIELCLSKPTPTEQDVCLLAALPVEAVKEAGIVANAVRLSGVVIAKASALLPMGSLCAAKATAGRAADASVVVNTTVACIKNSLVPSTSESSLAQ